MTSTLKIIQHNVLHWRTRNTGLSNIYRQYDPDIILINSHGLTNEQSLKIPGYRIHRKSTTNNQHDGTAIAIKHRLQHKLYDDFISDLLAIDVMTMTGKVTIATLYQPPSRPYIPTPDFIKLFRRQTPVYLMADLNANHTCLGYRTVNTQGKEIHRLIQTGIIQHIGPNFPTYFSARAKTTPDIILTNYRTHHNTLIEQGPLTTSDHLPIIVTISSTPIYTPAPPRPNYRQANWADYQTHINTHLDNNNLNDATPEDIDTAIENWTTSIHNATKHHIPVTHLRPLPAPQHSQETQNTITQYNALRTQAETHGWTYDHYTAYKELQRTLQDQLITDANDNWLSIIQETAATYTDPQVFWRKIRQLTSSSNTPDPHYLLDDRNKKNLHH